MPATFFENPLAWITASAIRVAAAYGFVIFVALLVVFWPTGKSR